MTKEELAKKLEQTRTQECDRNVLTDYAIQSIEQGRSSYPVSNLLVYCAGTKLQLIMVDMATEEEFAPTSALEVHQVLNKLMERYDVDHKLVYRKTAVHYTPPKTLDSKELERLQKTQKHVIPLSITTLLAVCSVIHCSLDFRPL